MNFRATTWWYKIENEVASLGFLGENFSKSVLIRSGASFDKQQDASMKKNSTYEQIGDAIFGVYDAIKRIEVKGNTIHRDYIVGC